MVDIIIYEVGNIMCDIGTINVRFYLLKYRTHVGMVELPFKKMTGPLPIMVFVEKISLVLGLAKNWSSCCLQILYPISEI
jgi:hypothetical protein